ncbi:MAG: tRNA preQ1(34) S-adenosylmethionine ribosyltransferase-isomerase QueA [Gammaproteobacteria bacterium]
MQAGDYNYALPENLIAQEPLANRADSRLLHLTPEGRLDDLRFTELPPLVNPGDLLVFNDTRVIPARLHARKATGGRAEILVERRLDAQSALVQLRASKSPPVGTRIEIAAGVGAQVTGRQGSFFLLSFDAPVDEILATHGHIPLPPYIKRPDNERDRERYQTVFAREPGAVAAPTAGLHFDRGQINRLRSRGVDVAYLTLHVGAGTFQPLRAEQLESGELHAEKFLVPEKLVSQIIATRNRGGRIIAVGTTVVRGLESAAATGELQPAEGTTSLFIRPGFEFRVVDALLTNFHLPESSLLMLVSAFAGHERIRAAYAHAIAQSYRFFSYGDAMFCHRQVS